MGFKTIAALLFSTAFAGDTILEKEVTGTYGGKVVRVVDGDTLTVLIPESTTTSPGVN